MFGYAYSCSTVRAKLNRSVLTDTWNIIKLSILSISSPLNLTSHGFWFRGYIFVRCSNPILVWYILILYHVVIKHQQWGAMQWERSRSYHYSLFLWVILNVQSWQIWCGEYLEATRVIINFPVMRTSPFPEVPGWYNVSLKAVHPTYIDLWLFVERTAHHWLVRQRQRRIIKS